MLIGNWRVFAAFGRLEAIAEPRAQRLRRRLIGVKVQPAAFAHEQRPEIVDAVGVVGVFMRDEHGIEPADVGVEQLFAQIRRRIDQHAG